MFNVHVVDVRNRADYQEELEAYFRLRHDIYVVERGWRDLARPDKREIDSFDTPSAIYLLGLAENKRVVAGSRLVPTLHPHLLSDVFPALAGGRVPRAADIFEWTRIFVVPELRTNGRPCRTAGAVYCAMLEYCLHVNIRHLSVVCEDYWIERLARLGWNPQRLGRSQEHGGTVIVALRLDMTRQALGTTRAFYGIEEGILHRSNGASEGQGICSASTSSRT